MKDQFKKAARVSDIPEGAGTTVKVGKKLIALFHIEGKFYAYDDACPHAYGPLGAGPIEKNVVICPWHGWQFNIQKGCAVMSEDVKLSSYEVKVKGKDVFVNLNQKEAD